MAWYDVFLPWRWRLFQPRPLEVPNRPAGETTLVRKKPLPVKPARYEEFLAALERKRSAEALLSDTRLLRRLHATVGLPKERVENLVADVRFRADRAAQQLRLPEELDRLYAVIEGEAGQRTGLRGEALEVFISAVKQAWLSKRVLELENAIRERAEGWITDRRYLVEAEGRRYPDIRSIIHTRRRLERELDEIHGMIERGRAHAPELERLRRESPFL